MKTRRETILHAMYKNAEELKSEINAWSEQFRCDSYSSLRFSGSMFAKVAAYRALQLAIEELNSKDVDSARAQLRFEMLKEVRNYGGEDTEKLMNKCYRQELRKLIKWIDK